MNYLMIIVGLSVLMGCGEIPERNCTMSEFGIGHCNFTNTGILATYECGKIEVEVRPCTSCDKQLTKPTAVLHSEIFCSGVLWPYITNRVYFKVPKVPDECRQIVYDATWDEICSFSFVSQ